MDDERDEYILLAAACRRCWPEALIDYRPDVETVLDELAADGHDGDRVDPDLVLVDLYMRPVDGFQVLDYRSRHLADRDLPFVVYTSSDETADRRRCRELGCDDFIEKPDGLRGLVDMVESRLRPLVEDGDGKPTRPH